MNGLQGQRGLSAIGWLFVITVFGFTLLVASKIGPYYLDNRFVVATLKNLADDPEFPRMSSNDIRTKLNKTFTINNIRGKARDSVKVVKNKEGNVVTIEYEERIHLLQNIDVVISFNSLLDSAKPDNCCRAPKGK